MQSAKSGMNIPRTRVTLEEIERVATGAEVRLTEEGRRRIDGGEREIARIMGEGMPVYGVNTGFGALANKAITADRVNDLQVNLIRSHAAGSGSPLGRDVVRATMFLRANMLSKGLSGVSRGLVAQLVAHLAGTAAPPARPTTL